MKMTQSPYPTIQETIHVGKIYMKMDKEIHWTYQNYSSETHPNLLQEVKNGYKNSKFEETILWTINEAHIENHNKVEKGIQEGTRKPTQQNKKANPQQKENQIDHEDDNSNDQGELQLVWNKHNYLMKYDPQVVSHD